MKKNSFVVILAVVMFCASCSKGKEEAAAPDVPVEGYWFGYYKLNAGSPKVNTALLVRPNGTMRYYELGIKVDTLLVPPGLKLDGTWSFSNNIFQFDLAIGTNHATALLSRNPAKTRLNGTYKVDGTLYGLMEYQKY